jgi:Mg-chelatase subunit ChlD
MVSARPVFLWVLLVFLVTACGGSAGLRLEMLDASKQRPSNVAVYFTVDTDDGQPVPGLQAESFRIYEDGDLVSVFESKQTILNPEVAAEHVTLLLVDMSGSVAESGDVPAIVSAATSFSERVGKYQKVGIYAFDGRKDIVRVTDFTPRGSSVASGAERLESFDTKDPSTNLNGAVIEALEVLDRELRGSSAPLRFGTLVVFTDGTDRAARVTKDDLDVALDGSEHEIVVIGVGAEIDESELGAIGRSGVIVTKDRAQIADAFEQAAAKIEAMSQRYYLLGYCSPARAGVHEVTYEGKTGSLTYEFDATGFKPDCDPTKPPKFDVRRPKKRRD